MKKRLEAELISIAHRILKLKNKSELQQLHTETQKLYHALTVLKFVEDNQNIIKPAIDIQEIEQNLALSLDHSETESSEIFALVNKNETVNQEISIEENVVDTLKIQQSEDLNEIEKEKIVKVETPETVESNLLDEEALENEGKLDFEPSFDLENEENEENEENTKTETPILFSFEDLLGHDYQEPIFEKVIKAEPIIESVLPAETALNIEITPVETTIFIEKTSPIEIERQDNYSATDNMLTDNKAKSIVFGLNDKIGFENNLFAGSAEDMNRVISQLNTFDSFQEAIDFIDEMVKPDYQDWDGKDDYVKRFMEIVAQKFE